MVRREEREEREERENTSENESRTQTEPRRAPTIHPSIFPHPIMINQKATRYSYEYTAASHFVLALQYRLGANQRRVLLPFLHQN